MTRSVTDLEDAQSIPTRDVQSEIALWLLCCAFLLDVMASTSVFTATPAIGRALDLTPIGLQWSITAATLTGASLLLVGGHISDVAGRKRTFLVGLGLFGVASLGCGVVHSLPLLILARVGQGLGGALLLPAALSLILTGSHVGGRTRGLAIWSAVGGLGATAGLLMGGLVTEGLGWRWVFLINVPASIAIFVVAALVLKEPSDRTQAGRLDLRGTALFTVGLALVIYGVSQGPNDGWRTWSTAGVASLGVILLMAFAVSERRAAAPILPAWLWRIGSVVSGNLTLLAAGMCVDGLLFSTTLYTQQELGLGALSFGAISAVMTVSSVGAAWVAQRAITRSGARAVSALGLVALCATSLVFMLATSISLHVATLLVGMVIFGFGMGCAFTAGSVGSLEGVRESEAGVAAAVQNISFGTGATLGVAALATVLAATGSVRAAFFAAAVIAATGAIGALAFGR